MTSLSTSALYVIAAVMIGLGIAYLVVSAVSARFRRWSERQVRKGERE